MLKPKTQQPAAQDHLPAHRFSLWLDGFGCGDPRLRLEKNMCLGPSTPCSCEQAYLIGCGSGWMLGGTLVAPWEREKRGSIMVGQAGGQEDGRSTGASGHLPNTDSLVSLTGVQSCHSSNTATRAERSQSHLHVRMPVCMQPPKGAEGRKPPCSEMCPTGLVAPVLRMQVTATESTEMQASDTLGHRGDHAQCDNEVHLESTGKTSVAHPPSSSGTQLL